jgi:subtilase-type serine protease
VKNKEKKPTFLTLYMVKRLKNNNCKTNASASIYSASFVRQHRPCAVAYAALLCCLAGLGSQSMAHADPYVEAGKLGDAASWRSAEFKADWGLGAIQADAAYAAGFSGKGVKLGIFDQPVYAKHPEFGSPDKVVNLVTEGTRLYTDPYIPVKAGDAFRYDGTPSLDSNGELGTHGTHVGGIAAGNRDGGPMHGVAFGAQIISAENGDPGPEDGIILGNDGAVYKAGWDALVKSGARIINNSWGIGLGTHSGNFTVKEAQAQFDTIKPILGTPAGGAYQGAIDAARSGVLTIFAAGNDYNNNNPDAMSGLGYFVPDIAPNWLSVAAMQRNPNTASADPYVISTFSSRCGYAASFCVSAPGSVIYSSVINGTTPQDLTTGYANFNGTSMAAPHVAGSAAVLMERFAYMSGDQISTLLKTTATDLGAPGIDSLYGWGMINLAKAINGPGMLVTAVDIPTEFRIAGAYGTGQFVANLPGIGAIVDKDKPTQRVCTDAHCAQDTWSNDISGHGGLTKQGIGALTLTGNSTYSGPTLVNQGLLSVNGSLASDVTVSGSGVLGGSGRIGSLNANSGATVAPGNSIGTLNVAGNVRFAAGSTYAVQVDYASRQSDSIAATGKATVEGGTVKVLAGGGDFRQSSQYNILSAQGGVAGTFSDVNSNFAFLTPSLSYSAQNVFLTLDRNDVSFEAIGQSPNQYAIAPGVETLQVANPVYHAVAQMDAPSARAAFNSLSGEIHASERGALVIDSQLVRDGVNARLRAASGTAGASTAPVTASDEGTMHAAAANAKGPVFWVQALGSKGRTEGDGNAAAVERSADLFAMGVDTDIAGDWRVGLTGGHSSGKVDVSDRASSGTSDSYHLGLYGGKAWGSLALRTGLTYAWHDIETSRQVGFQGFSDNLQSAYSANTSQVFGELGYSMKAGPIALEPFANLAYVDVHTNAFQERGAAAALTAQEGNTAMTFSTLGAHASTQLSGSLMNATLRGTLGWRHAFGSTTPTSSLAFASAGSPVDIAGVPIDRDAAVVVVGLDIALSPVSTLGFAYSAQMGPNATDQSLQANLSLRF